MKRIIGALCLLCAFVTVQVQCADTDFDKNELQHQINESNCVMDETVTLDEAVEFLHNGDIEVVEENPKLKCFSACFLKYLGLIDECSLEFDETKLRFVYKDEEKVAVHQIMEACKAHVNATEPCECGFQMIQCLDDLDMSNENED